MSDKPGDKRGTHSPPPKTEEGKVDKDKVRDLFMASKHLEWAPFARAMNWDSIRSRQEFNVNEWISEKKRIMAREQAEQIGAMLFEHRGKWHKQALSCLQELPEANQTVLNILKYRMNQYVEMINQDEKLKKFGGQEALMQGSTFAKVKTSELLSLAWAMETTTKSYQRSLLLDSWSVKAAEEFTTPEAITDADEKGGKANKEWRISLVGGEEISVQRLELFARQYLDQPQTLPEALETTLTTEKGSEGADT